MKIKEWLQQETVNLTLLEAQNKKGWCIWWRRKVLHTYRLIASREVKTKYFWFFERLKLPPFWWKTKTFKIVTALLCVTVVVTLAFYYKDWLHSEGIVDSVKTEISTDSNMGVSSEESVDLPKSYDTTLYSRDKSGDISYNYMQVDLSSALARNSDVVGWINVPDLGIDYPVVQTTNNEFYLSHDLDKNGSSQGWVFADYRCAINSATPNLVLYGHNLMSGGMFTSLNNLFNMNKDVYVRFQTKTETCIYKVVSVYETSPSAKYIRQDFESADDIEKFFSEILRANQWGYIKNESNTLSANDKVLTLSTCRGNNARVVAHCKLITSKLLEN